MADITVLKQGGDKETFSLDKVIVSIAKAGLPLKSAEEIGGNIQEWIKQNSVDGEVQSSDIKAKVLEEIEKVDPLVASTYDSYVK